MPTKNVAAALLASALALSASGAANAHGDHTAAIKALSERFKAADADADGSVTREEWDAHLRARFAGYDKNGDGRIAGGEIDALLATIQAVSGGDLASARAELLKAYDKDGDTAVSRMEYVGGGLARFDAWDLDKNAAVDKAEQEAELARMAG